MQYISARRRARWPPPMTPSWGRVSKAISHPVPGNHEYIGASRPGCTNAVDAYYVLRRRRREPATGYYSYDLGSWHVIALNTNTSCSVIACSAGSPQEQWLKPTSRPPGRLHPRLLPRAAVHLRQRGGRRHERGEAVLGRAPGRGRRGDPQRARPPTSASPPRARPAQPTRRHPGIMVGTGGRATTPSAPSPPTARCAAPTPSACCG